MPYHYVEIARLLLHNARSNIENPNRLEERLGDLADARHAKIRKGLQQITTGTTLIKLNNISSMELNTIRSFCLNSMGQFQKLSTNYNNNENNINNNNNNQNQNNNNNNNNEQDTEYNTNQNNDDDEDGVPGPITLISQSSQVEPVNNQLRRYR